MSFNPQKEGNITFGAFLFIRCKEVVRISESPFREIPLYMWFQTLHPDKSLVRSLIEFQRQS